MAVREIPKSYEYMCDIPGCGCVHLQENAGGGHYHNSCPPGWVWVRVVYSLEETQAAAGANLTKERLLCARHAQMLAALFAHLSGPPQDAAVWDESLVGSPGAAP